MNWNRGLRLYRSVLPLILGLWMSATGWAQETLTFTTTALTEGIDLPLSVGELGGESRYLIVQDTLGGALALRAVELDGRAVWLRRSREPAPAVDFPVVHWYDEEKSGLVVVDIRNLRPSLTSTSVIHLRLVPMAETAAPMYLRIYESAVVPGMPPENLPLLKELRVEIKP